MVEGKKHYLLMIDTHWYRKTGFIIVLKYDFEVISGWQEKEKSRVGPFPRSFRHVQTKLYSVLVIRDIVVIWFYFQMLQARVISCRYCQINVGLTFLKVSERNWLFGFKCDIGYQTVLKIDLTISWRINNIVDAFFWVFFCED